MKTRHAILIDSATKTIKIVELGKNDLESAYKFIGCDMIEAAFRFPNGDVIYVDEEALIVPKATGKFFFNGIIIQGRGLIVNEGDSEMWNAPKTPIKEIISAIEF